MFGSCFSLSYYGSVFVVVVVVFVVVVVVVLGGSVCFVVAV